jgi:hypothetical protein
MTITTRRISVLGGALAILTAVVLLSFRGCAPAVTAGDGTGDANTGGLMRTVLIEGDVVEPIAPGVMVPLDLEFTNPHDVDLSLTNLSVTVHEVTAPNSDEVHSCAVVDFAVEQAPSDLRITVAAGATSTLSGLGLPSAVWPRMGMHDRPVNQDGCKGASLTLDYSAAGTPGDR